MGLCVKGAYFQGVQGDHTPAPTFHVQRQAHAVMHGHWLTRVFFDQAVIRVGQGAVVVETGDTLALQDGREARVVLHRKTSPQRVAGEPVHGDGAQVFFFEFEQGHGTAVEVGTQAAHQALQAHRCWQVGHQIGQQQ